MWGRPLKPGIFPWNSGSYLAVPLMNISLSTGSCCSMMMKILMMVTVVVRVGGGDDDDGDDNDDDGGYSDDTELNRF